MFVGATMVLQAYINLAPFANTAYVSLSTKLSFLARPLLLEGSLRSEV